MNLENKKNIVTFILAVALGVVTVVLTGKFVDDRNKENAKKLADQIELERKNAEQREMALVNEIGVVKKQMQQMESQIIAKLKEKEGQEMEAGLPATFALRTPPGKRALTIAIDSLSAVGGLISPGDFVDIIAHLNVPQFLINPMAGSGDSKGGSVTTILFQNIEVLAVGTNFKMGSSGSIYENQQKAGSLNVTLAVTAEEASLLTFAQPNGKLQFSLRAPTEQGVEKTEIASWNALSDFIEKRQGTKLFAPKKEEITEEEIKEPPKPVIQIFRSGEQR